MKKLNSSETNLTIHFSKEAKPYFTLCAELNAELNNLLHRSQSALRVEIFHSYHIHGYCGN